MVTRIIFIVITASNPSIKTYKYLFNISTVYNSHLVCIPVSKFHMQKKNRVTLSYQQLAARSLTRLPACCCLLGEPETTDSDVTDRRANSPLVRGRLTPILSIVHWQCNDKRTDNRFYTTNSCPLRADNGISLCLRLTDGPLKLFQSGTKRRSAAETHTKIL